MGAGSLWTSRHDRATGKARLQHLRIGKAVVEHLPSNPVVTVPRAAGLLRLTAPPARKAIELLESLGVLGEISGKRRGRAYAYHEYVDALIGPDG